MRVRWWRDRGERPAHFVRPGVLLQQDVRSAFGEDSGDEVSNADGRINGVLSHPPCPGGLYIRKIRRVRPLGREGHNVVAFRVWPVLSQCEPPGASLRGARLGRAAGRPVCGCSMDCVVSPSWHLLASPERD